MRVLLVAAALGGLIAACAAAATDLNGHTVRLFTGDTTVVVFVRTDCPISNRYAPELKRLYRDYSSRVKMYLVYPDLAESAELIRKHISEFNYPLTPLRDGDHRLVRLSKARVTPEAAVFSGNGDLLYHGRIDDSYVDFGKFRAQPTRHDLRDALDAILRGAAVTRPSTHAIGCFLADIQ